MIDMASAGRAGKSTNEDAKKLLKFIDASPTPYQGAEVLGKMLEESGAEKLDEKKSWGKLVPGKNYYIIRNDSCIAAFRLGKNVPEDDGWHVSLSHMDYPCLRVRPHPASSANSYVRVNVETYGGLIEHSWFDRPLGLAGRVYVRSQGSDGFEGVNVNFDRPLLLVPELAIHMNRGVNDGAKFSSQSDILPFLAGSADGKDASAEFIKMLAKELKTAPENIVSFDLSAYDCQKSCFTGENGEFVSAPHLDNGEMVFCSFTGFIDAGKTDSAGVLPDHNSLVIAFDHEEIGSLSDRGARSNLLTSLIRRIAFVTGGNEESVDRALANTVICSADMAHASHPSHPETYDAEHKVFLNRGPVLKHSYSQSYIESPGAAAIFKDYCSRGGIPFQEFVNRNDLRGGSTVGPMSSASAGATGFDIGNAIFSMHSIREFGGTLDVKYATDFFRVFHK